MLQGQQHLLYGDDGYNHRPEENIYEEVDLMTLNSLRAQYADTPSLQSWKKKGSKRALATNSFSKWFSTRKKSPLVGDEESAYTALCGTPELRSSMHYRTAARWNKRDLGWWG